MLYKKENSKYWYTKFELSFGEKQQRINKSKRQVKKSDAEKIEQQLRDKIWQQLTSNQQKQHRFLDALALYVESRSDVRTKKRKLTKLEWWSEQLKNPSINEITTEHLLKALSSKPNLDIAPKNRYLAEIKAFLNFCCYELDCLDKVPNIKIAKEAKREFFKLSTEDINRLIFSAHPI